MIRRLIRRKFSVNNEGNRRNGVIFGNKVWTMYIHENKDWWQFRYDAELVVNRLGAVRAKQGRLIGQMEALGFSVQDESTLNNMSLELVRSSEIEGEVLNLNEVRSSIAHRLGIQTGGLIPSSRYVDGIVEMQLDATVRYDAPMSDERLFGWHNVLFPTGMSGLYRIEVGKYRTGEMQVVSGAMGHEKVHYQAPSPEKVPMEMQRLIQWMNEEDDTDGVLKAAIAHLWFVSIHPFDDGNGRIARALTDMLLARSEHSAKRFYSLSAEIKTQKKEYYEVLEATQHGDGDITQWLLWFLQCLDKAIEGAFSTLEKVMQKNEFWNLHKETPINERQRKILDLLFGDFFGVLTTSKWAKIAKCSQDTALNDINDLVRKGILKKNEGGGRSSSYGVIS